MLLDHFSGPVEDYLPSKTLAHVRDIKAEEGFT
jgi:hypothetical protein